MHPSVVVLLLTALFLIPLCHSRSLQDQAEDVRRLLRQIRIHSRTDAKTMTQQVVVSEVRTPRQRLQHRINQRFKIRRGKDSSLGTGFVDIGHAPKRNRYSSAAISASAMSASAMAPGQSEALPPPPAPPMSPQEMGCPPTVDQCDFFFDGNSTTVPTFSLTGPPDTPMSPSIMTSVQQPMLTVGAINTGTAEYICSQPSPAPDNQFYFTKQPPVLQHRTFSSGITFQSGQYVKLSITSAQVSAFGMTLNLNEGESNPQFPSERRCIIFQVDVGTGGMQIPPSN